MGYHPPTGGPRFLLEVAIRGGPFMIGRGGAYSTPVMLLYLPVPTPCCSHSGFVYVMRHVSMLLLYPDFPVLGLGF